MPPQRRFADSSLKNFLEALGSSSAAPGGGAAAALAGAAGNALVEMVVRINAQRRPQAGVSQKITRISKRRMEFLSWMQEDVEAFEILSRFSRDQRKKPSYQRALKRCAKAPFKVCELAVATTEDAVSEFSRTSRWLSSDLKEAGFLLSAAFDSAHLNVEANLGLIGDRGFVRSTRKAIARQKKRLRSAVKKLKRSVKT